MQEIIVADTSCLILLEKIQRIDLLQKLFGSISITPPIAEEFQSELPDFIKVKNIKNLAYQKIIAGHLDEGEASAIALALEHPKSLLIIDESKGRKEAHSLKINYTGTIGILLLAKEKKIITSIKEVLNEIEKTNFHISKQLINRALELSREK